MSNLQLVFSPRAKERLLQIAEYLAGQGLENAFVIEYLNQFELWLNKVLLEFVHSIVWAKKQKASEFTPKAIGCWTPDTAIIRLTERLVWANIDCLEQALSKKRISALPYLRSFIFS